MDLIYRKCTKCGINKLIDQYGCRRKKGRLLSRMCRSCKNKYQNARWVRKTLIEIESLKDEIWKDIKGYKGLYQISNFGRVKSLSKISSTARTTKRQQQGKLINQRLCNVGYMSVTLYAKKNIKHNTSCLKTKNIHRLLAIAFIPNPDKKPCVNHKDLNKLNNNLDNLEWCTYSENTQHYRKHLNLK